MSFLSIGILGLGKVGQTLFHVLREHDFDVVTVYNRTPDIADTLTQNTDVIVAETIDQLIQHADLIMLAVTDDAIGLVVNDMAQSDWSNKALIHTSGAKDIHVLEPIKLLGGMIGSLHPALPFADVQIAQERIIGATFAIEYSDLQLRDWLMQIIAHLDGKILEIPVGKKAQYHLALVIASNYMVTHYAIAESLMADFADDPIAIQTALNTLVSSTAENLTDQGVPDAFTGPLVRGDIATITAHLEALQGNTLLQNTYINLAKLSYPMLTERGTDIRGIEQLFKDYTHASDDS